VIKFASVFCVAVGGALAFFIQPILAKILLPELGGGAGVWIVVSILFQLGVFLGYLYALILLKSGAGVQLFVNGAFMLLVGIATFSAVAATEHGGSKVGLVLSAALAYILLSSTSPLVQTWLARGDGRGDLGNVYSLFSFSNLAGIVALFSYPFLIETNFGLRSQLDLWVVFFLFYCLFFFYLTLKNPGQMHEIGVMGDKERVAPSWYLIPLITSAYLLSMTTAFSQNIPSSPFIWTIPLSLYLLSYALVFSGIYVPAVGFSIFVVLALQLLPLFLGRMDVGQFDAGNFYTHCSILFFVCVLLHGELFKRRPTREGLPLFYISLAGGGLVGGVAAAVLIPLAFSNYEETWFFHLGGFAVAGLMLFFRNLKIRIGFAIVVFGLLLFFHSTEPSKKDRDLVRSIRNFYGAYSVFESTERDPRRVLRHGGTTHGEQYTTVGEGRKPTTYYTGDGGMGVAFRVLQLRNRAIRAICVGVGVGTAAAWVGAGDHLTFVDIDPDIIKVAEEDFSFVDDARTRGVRVDFLVGDGRKVLSEFPKESADLLVLDAFVGGSIPVHLLTKEAFELYSKLLKEDGVLAVHVSSRSLKLQGVALAGAVLSGLNCQQIDSKGGDGGVGSSWVLCSKKTEVVRQFAELSPEVKQTTGQLISWSDDFSSVFPLLKR
jgi:hypothetical protein